MKHIFIKKSKGSHVRISDSVRGDLITLPDTAIVNPESSLVSIVNFIVFEDEEAQTGVRPDVPISNVPHEIANWRAKAILQISGLLPSVEIALASMKGEAGIVARAAWTAGAPLVRFGPTVTAISTKLKLTSEQIDNMFIRAAALQV
jgi:hypothetical protein